MTDFSATSRRKLMTCHPKLIGILEEAIKWYDFSVLVGHRGAEEQNDAFDSGRSKLKWPDSRHNKVPSRAVDIAPYPIDWKNEKEFHYLAGLVMGIAISRGVRLRWGGRWTSLNDLPHFELSDEEA